MVVGLHQGGRRCGLQLLIAYSDSGGGGGCGGGSAGSGHHQCIEDREILLAGSGCGRRGRKSGGGRGRG